MVATNLKLVPRNVVLIGAAINTACGISLGFFLATSGFQMFGFNHSMSVAAGQYQVVDSRGIEHHALRKQYLSLSDSTGCAGNISLQDELASLREQLQSSKALEKTYREKLGIEQDEVASLREQLQSSKASEKTSYEKLENEQDEVAKLRNHLEVAYSKCDGVRVSQQENSVSSEHVSIGGAEEAVTIGYESKAKLLDGTRTVSVGSLSSQTDAEKKKRAAQSGHYRGVVTDVPKTCTCPVVTAYLGGNRENPITAAKVQPVDALAPYLQSLAKLGSSVCPIIVHDGTLWSQIDWLGKLNEELQERGETQIQVSVIEMNATAFYPEDDYSLDVRFLMWQRLLQDNANWQEMWTIDSFDSVVHKSPCNTSLLPRGPLYVQEEVFDITPLSDDVKNKNPWLYNSTLLNPYIRARSDWLGGKYNAWYEAEVEAGNHAWTVFNCGLLGGARSVLLEFFAALAPLLIDLDAKRQVLNSRQRYDQGFCMFFFNYLLYQPEWRGRARGGSPLHSLFKAFEFGRTDVVFRHK